VVITLLAVRCVIRHSVTSANGYPINAYIGVFTIIAVRCVIRHSVKRAI